MKRKRFDNTAAGKRLVPRLTKRILPLTLAAAIIITSPSVPLEGSFVNQEGRGNLPREFSAALFSRRVSAAPESWYLNDYEFFKSQTLSEANEAYQNIRLAEYSEEGTPEANMLQAANYLRRLCGLPSLRPLSVQADGSVRTESNPELFLPDSSTLLSGPERKGYTPVGAVFRMPGEGYTPGKWLNYDRLGRDFLSYRTGEALFLFDEDKNGLTIGSCKIPNPDIEWETKPEPESEDRSDFEDHSDMEDSSNSEDSSDSENTSDFEDSSDLETTSDAENESESESLSEPEGDSESEEENKSEEKTEANEETESEEETETVEEEEPVVPLPFYPYPSAGYFPANLIAANTTAWSVELNSDYIGDPDSSTWSKLQVTILDMVTGDTFTRTVSDQTLEVHTTLTGSKILVFTPPETSIFDGVFGDQAGFRVTVKGLSDTDGRSIRAIEWQTVFFTPKSEDKLHLLSVSPEQNQVRFTEGSIAPENLKLFSAFLPVNALCASRESAFLIPLGSWEPDAEDFTWRTHPNLAAFMDSPIYASVDNPNLLKQRISLPFTFSDNLPKLTVEAGQVMKGQDFTFALSPAKEDADYYLYQVQASEGKAVLSLRAHRKYATEGSVTFPMPKMENDHKGIYFALISEKNRLTFSNFLFLDPDQHEAYEVTLPEGLIALSVAQESDFKSKAFEEYEGQKEVEESSEENKEPETEEVSTQSIGRQERPEHPEDDMPLLESLYQKSTTWMSHHKTVLFWIAGVLIFLTVIMTLLQQREQRTYRNPSAIKVRKKKKPDQKGPEAQPTEKNEKDSDSISVEDL